MEVGSREIGRSTAIRLRARIDGMQSGGDAVTVPCVVAEAADAQDGFKAITALGPTSTAEFALAHLVRLAKRSASLDSAYSCLVAPGRLVDADVVHLNLSRKDSRVGGVAVEITTDRQIHDDEEGLIERRRIKVA